MRMGLEEFKGTVERKVWESSDGTILLAVSGMLDPGKYEVEKGEDIEGREALVFKQLDE